MDRACPPFRLDKSRYDQNTFYGRLKQMLDVIDPRTLFVSQHELQKSVELLELFKEGKTPVGVTNENLWQAKKIKQAILHPDTGDKIFMPFRMSGFVPFGTPIVVGLLLPNLTLPQTVFWQWFNQSHNACVNYANRNASKPTNMKTFLQGYAGAVSSAVSIAIGLTLVLKKSKSLPPSTRNLIQRFVPFPAVATASVLNIFLMRRHEMHEGIEVLDSTGKVIGTSKIAANQALKETAVTRAILPAPILLIPPLIMTQLEKTRWLKKFPKAHLPLNALFVTLSFGLALPVAIALFPQTSQIEVKDLEPLFAQSTSEKVLIYNKGL